MALSPYQILIPCAALGAVALGVVTVHEREQSNTPAHAVFAETTHKIASINAGEGIDVKFPVQNTGGKPLHILSVDRSCGCMSPQFPPVIQGHSHGEIAVRFEPLANWSGHMDKELTVHTDDPAAAQTKLHLVAEVVPILKMEPQNPLQIMTHRGKSYGKDMVLTPRQGTRMQIKSVVSDNPLVKAKLVPPRSGDSTGAYHLKVTVGPIDQPGDFIANVRLTTTDARLPIANVVVAALSLEGPVVNPREITFSGLDNGAADKEITQLQVFTRSGELRVLGAESQSPLLKTVVQPVTPNHMYNVSLRQAKAWKTGRLTTSIKIRTSDPKNPVLVVPFDVTVR